MSEFLTFFMLYMEITSTRVHLYAFLLLKQNKNQCIPFPSAQFPKHHFSTLERKKVIFFRTVFTTHLKPISDEMIIFKE